MGLIQRSADQKVLKFVIIGLSLLLYRVCHGLGLTMLTFETILITFEESLVFETAGTVKMGVSLKTNNHKQI